VRARGYAGDPAPRPAPYIARGTTWWAMLLTLFVLGSMLAALVFAYFYLRAGFPTWPPPPTGDPPLGRAAVSSGLLVLSGLPVAAAHLAARSGRPGNRLPAALATGIALGVAFLLVQWADYATGDIDPQRDVYGSLFLAMAGFHHVNAVLALIGLGIVALKVRGTRMSPREQETAVTAAHYWYFVVGSWLVIAFLLYITPRFW
jgi:cytochrome c oxidase subunit 3